MPVVIRAISDLKSFLMNRTESNVHKGTSLMPNATKSLIGFVPTMGFLHTGHLSLVKRSTAECHTTVVSIFVNPKQFGINEDFARYPRDLDRDIKLLSDYNVDVVFHPDYDEMYPSGFKTFVEIEKISNLYCGESRTGHFKGVATIVNKLVNIIKPNFMYMGEKDFQQVYILEQMLRDLNLQTKIVRCHIIRENDGLAMSSRNVYLLNEQRQHALCLHKALLLALELYNKGECDTRVIKKEMIKLIQNTTPPSSTNETDHISIEYIAFINEQSFEAVDFLDKDSRILIAVKIGKTRLIDNMKIEINRYCGDYSQPSIAIKDV